MIHCLLLFWVGFLVGPTFAMPPASLKQANQAYLQENYANAAEGYERALAYGWDNGHVHYNLGTTYLQQGKLGPAIRHLLDARLKLPRDEDVSANLETALRQTQDLLEWEQPYPASALLFWLEDFNLREHLWTLFWIHLAFWSVMGIGLFQKNEPLVLVRRMLAGLLLIAVISTGTRWHLEALSPFAVVASKTLDVVAGDGPKAQVLFQLHEGTVLRVLQTRELWMEIELPDGKRGWVPRDQMLT